MRLTGQLHNTVTLTLALNITRASVVSAVETTLKSTRNGFQKNELLPGLPAASAIFRPNKPGAGAGGVEGVGEGTPEASIMRHFS